VKSEISLIAQPNFIYLDVSISVRDLCQKKLFTILLPVLATVVMRRDKKSVVRVAQCNSCPRPGS